jgi:hypothetical protein
MTLVGSSAVLRIYIEYGQRCGKKICIILIATGSGSDTDTYLWCFAFKNLIMLNKYQSMLK